MPRRSFLLAAAVLTLVGGPALAAPTVDIVSPAPNTELLYESPGIAITVVAQFTDATVGLDDLHVSWRLDGVEVAELATTAAFTFVPVPLGYRHLAVWLVDSDGDPLDDPESQDGVFVKVVPDGCATVDDCEDGLTCSNQACTGGSCKYGPVPGCCDHDGHCGFGEWCVGGACVECVSAADCDDGDACTTDSCGVDGACVHEPIEGCCFVDEDCDDQNPCTLETCGLGGACAEPVVIPGCCASNADCIDPASPCTLALCYQPSGLSASPYCRFGPAASGCCTGSEPDECDDGNPCTTDSCVLGDGPAGECSHVEVGGGCCQVDGQCDDGDPGTLDLCVDNVCEFPTDPEYCTMTPPGSLVITELMAAPGDIADGLGEWFEVFNATDELLDITGWTIDDGTTVHTISESGSLTGLMIPPRSYMVLARAHDADLNGGLKAGYIYGVDVTLQDPIADGEDFEFQALRIRDAEGVRVDDVFYDGTWPFEDGHSIEVVHPYVDNSEPTAWKVAGQNPDPGKNTSYGFPEHGLIGSPGSRNTSSFEGLEAPTCDVGPAPHPCAVGYCDDQSGCFVDLAPGCCASDEDCSDFDGCTQDTCDTQTGTCGPSVPIDGCCDSDADCDDGNPCNLDRCIAKGAEPLRSRLNGRVCAWLLDHRRFPVRV